MYFKNAFKLHIFFFEFKKNEINFLKNFFLYYLIFKELK